MTAIKNNGVVTDYPSLILYIPVQIIIALQFRNVHKTNKGNFKWNSKSSKRAGVKGKMYVKLRDMCVIVMKGKGNY